VVQLARAAARQGIIFEYGVLSAEPTPFPLLEALSNSLTLRGYLLMEITLDPAKLKAAVKYVYDRLADGRFMPKIAKTFPFAQSAEAYRYLESNQQVGKVVITMT
jgi:NADPH:quinone reductase-like Zn-dependent oxidoreductase